MTNLALIWGEKGRMEGEMAVDQGTGAKVISTGNREVDKKLGGGLPIGSLVLLEGQSDSGKSVISQHFTHGALTSRLSTAYYTTENTVKSLMSQMSSLDMDVTDYFLCDRLRIYPILSTEGTDSSEAFQLMLNHFKTLPATTSFVVIDSLTGLVTHADERVVIDFFSACKQLCDQGKTIVAIVHVGVVEDDLLIRIRALCDAHLNLRIEQMGERLVKVMEVAKVRNAVQNTGNVVNFDVEPGFGMKIIQMNKAKA